MKSKKIVSALLSLAVVGGALPLPGTVLPDYAIEASAEEEYTEGTYGEFTYRNYGDYVEISECNESAEGEFVIPYEIDGVPVTNIGDYAFSDCSGLTSVTIPNSVTNIGDSAFEWCSGLTSITIPDSVTNIGGHAFSNCSGLTIIDVTENNKYYSSENGVLFNKDKTVLIQYPTGNTRTEYIIPDSVTNIDDWAFSGCSGLTSVTIPDSVAGIGENAFYYCSGLTSITIPDSVTNIEDHTFSGCSGLTSVTIPDRVTNIGDYAFFECYGLTSVTIPNSVKKIGYCAFFYCSGLTSITIPNSVINIDGGAFAFCSGLTSITIANPDCKIYDSLQTINNDSTDDTRNFYFTGTIYGYENSTAQAYAEKYNITFESLGEAPSTLPGDADLSGDVEIADAVKIMCYVTDPENNAIEPQGILNGDVYQTGDGLSVQDALSIQKYLAQIITELPES